MKKSLLAFSVAALLACPTAFAGESGVVDAVPSGTRCKQEAKICPDGKAVQRTGPNCQFAACSSVATEPTCTVIEGNTSTTNPKALTRKTVSLAEGKRLHERSLTADEVKEGKVFAVICPPDGRPR